MRTRAALAVFLLSALPAPAQWDAQTSGTRARLRGLSVVNAQTAWASGTGGAFTRTSDGGRTWQAGTVPGASDLDFRDGHAFDDRTACLLSSGPGVASRIVRTTDGGRTWETVYQNRDPKGFLDAIAFFDADHGLALGDPVESRFVILKTVDGGRSWSPVPPSAMPPARTGEGAFAASGTCLALGPNGRAWFVTGSAQAARVFRSADGGSTWSAHETPVAAQVPSAGLFSVAFRDEAFGVAVGGDYKQPDRNGQNVALTEDGGRTWRTPKGTPPRGYRSAVAILAGARGARIVAVGPSGSDLSTDGGENWRPLDQVGYHAVASSGPGAVWAAGDDGRVARLRSWPTQP